MIGQSAALNLNNEQLQVLLTGKFGDGCLVVPRSENSNSYYSTNCIHKEFKQKLLGDLANSINYVEHNGFAQKPIYRMSTSAKSSITQI